MRPCDCKEAGWCPLAKFHVTSRERELCSTDMKYRKLFRSADAPQRARERIEHPHYLPVGDWLASLIKLITFGKAKPKPGCGCQKRQEQLNETGNRLAGWWRRLSTTAFAFFPQSPEEREPLPRDRN
jgi:hypothetical protein